MNKANLTALLKAVKAMIMRERVAYKDYLGEETVTRLLISGTLQGGERGSLTLEDPTFTGFVVGETYQIMIDGQTTDCVASRVGNVIALVVGEPDSDNYAAVAFVRQEPVSMVFGSYVGKSVTVSQTKTTKKYRTKKLPTELLPDGLAKSADVSKVAAAAKNAQTTAETAQTTAETAKTTAETAKTTADAAQSTADAAKTTAETAKTTAETAKTTAESIKPNWNEKNSSKPGYIANRPFYHDITTGKTPLNRPTASAKLLIDGTELYWSGLVSGTNLFQIVKNKIYVLVGTLEKFTPIKFRNSYSYAYALGNPSLIKAQLPNAKAADGGELPDTGGDWVYYHTPGSSTVVTISKTNGWYGKFEEFLSEDLKLLDEKFIPASIQRTGGEVFLHSSTPNSTKKFKITVNDSGMISATEVVE